MQGQAKILWAPAVSRGAESSCSCEIKAGEFGWRDRSQLAWGSVTGELAQLQVLHPPGLDLSL